jgi:hypothetical protein
MPAITGFVFGGERSPKQTAQNGYYILIFLENNQE